MVFFVGSRVKVGNNVGIFFIFRGGRGAGGLPFSVGVFGGGIKDQKSIDIINTARANKNFLKNLFFLMLIPAFSDSFFDFPN